MATGFDLSTLVAYRDEHALDLKGKMLWAGDSLKYFQKVPGVTNVATINYFDVNPIIQYSTFCQSMTATGGTPVNQKDITVCDMKAEDSWCENTLQKYYFTTQLKGVAGDTLVPWEKQFMDQVTMKVLQANEVAVWNNSGHTGCTGLIQQIEADSARHTVSGSVTVTASNVIPIIQAMVTDLVTNASNISQDNELYLFVSPAVHAMYKQAMFSANNFGRPLIDDNGDLVIEFLGPKITMHSTYGLIGTNYMVLTTLKNLYHAFDGQSDDEKVSLWYEQKDDVLYYRVKYRLGVTFWLADYIVCNF